MDHLDLTVPPSSFFGLVGPNGAGKTTSLSKAVGLLRPDGGSARVFGVDVWVDPVRVKRLLGILPDGLALPERLTGRELLTYLGRLRGLDEATCMPLHLEVECPLGTAATRQGSRSSRSLHRRSLSHRLPAVPNGLLGICWESRAVLASLSRKHMPLLSDKQRSH